MQKKDIYMEHLEKLGRGNETDIFLNKPLPAFSHLNYNLHYPPIYHIFHLKTSLPPQSHPQ